MVAVGEPSQVYRSQDWPAWRLHQERGLAGMGTPTGSAVTAIVDAGRFIEVYSEEPSRGWANPSMVGHGEVMSIEWISVPGGEANPA